MYNEPPKNFLYSAYKLVLTHSDGAKSLEGSATGFILTVGNGIPWIVTNRHVVDLDWNKPSPKYKDFKLVRLDIIGRKPDDSEYTVSLDLNPTLFFHENINNDVALILPKVLNPDSVSFYWHFGLEHLASKEDYGNISPFDTVCFSGYPSTHDKLMGRPILRSGVIASDPNFNYSWDKDDHGNCVAYEGFSTEGSSGSPIYAPSRGMTGIPESRNGFLIGVNAGHIPEGYGHSGISYFYKSTVIHEIIEMHNLKNYPK